ncbi:MAG TPA: FAD:protein FMN transferase [Longimicrobiales bacterium]|nr:FAD:protein FMN transferase [Longimicrobiales bacterium]
MTHPNWPDRRRFLEVGLGAFAVAALPGLLRPGRRLVRRSVPVMGTVAELAVVTRHERHGQRALDAAVAELRRIDALMTRFREDSDVGRANLTASRGWVPVSRDTAAVLEIALQWARASEGTFDPAVGRAVALWDVGRRRVPPATGAVAELAGRELWRAVEVDASGAAPRVRFHDPGVALDLGGIAKGYAVDLAARALRHQGVFDALVNAGGDLSVMGRSAEGDAWVVGVRSPDDPARLVASLRVGDAAIATSGDYLQYFEHRGRRYHHLMDPAAAAPRPTRMRTLTVVAHRCVDADAGATAVFGMPREWASEVLARGRPESRIAHVG